MFRPQALLDQIEHAPDSTGRVSAAKALTNLSLSTACRSVMTARGLQPLVEMLRPDVSEPEGESTKQHIPLPPPPPP